MKVNSFIFSFDMNRDNSNIAKFLRAFAVVGLMLISADMLIGSLLKYYYFKQSSGFLYLSTYALDSTRANCLIFGSSRADHHYVPSVFEKKLHTTVFNCGSSGTRLIYSAALVSAVLNRYSPRHVIIDLRPDDLTLSEEGTLSPLLPYHDNPSVEPFLKYNSRFEYYKLWSKMYPYNSMLTNIIAGNLPFNKKRFVNDRGYMNLSNVLAYHPPTQFVNAPVMADRVEIFDDMLKKLYYRHIDVTVVISPFYFKMPDNDRVAIIAKQLCSKYSNTRYYNYENATAFNDNKLFSDEKHMNSVGANKFSEDLANRMIASK